MCGRFIITGTWEEFRRYMNILPPEVAGRNGPEPNYNVAPTSELEIVVREDKSIGIETVPWGLVPHWAKDSKIRPMINARGETVAEKPMFRTAFEYGRCLIPANGYYEWHTENGAKQAYLIHLDGDAPAFEPFAFAGIMARNRNLEKTSFAIVTLAAHPSISHLHDRMPVVLKPDALKAWIDPDTGKSEALDLLQQNRGADFVFHRVSNAVGNVRTKGPETIEPV
ncbi:MAG: SOS response-associated peptidase [Pseudomonadota bacterium]